MTSVQIVVLGVAIVAALFFIVKGVKSRKKPSNVSGTVKRPGDIER